MEPARAKSRIVGVTVYREGARVLRVADIAKNGTSQASAENGAENDAEASVAAGRYPEKIRITGLPLAMQDATVRVSVLPVDDASRDPVPVAADVRVTLDVPDGDEELAPPVDEELEAARRVVKELDGRVAQVKRELARVQRLTVAPRAKPAKGEAPAPPPESPTGSRLALLALREEREHTLRNELAELHAEYREAALQAKKLADRYKRATTARQAHEHELRKAVVVSLTIPSPTSGDTGGGTSGSDGDDGSHPYRASGGSPSDADRLAPRARLTLQYMVPGARWAPAYNARLSDGKATFAMRAVVAQETGEDWTGVALALSTADAQGWSELPELSSIRIGRRQRRPPKAGWRPPPAGAELLYGDYDRGFSGGGNVTATVLGRDDEDSREITTRMKPYGAAASIEGRDTLEYQRAEPGSEPLAVFDVEEVTGEVDKPMLSPAPARSAGPPPMGAPSASLSAPRAQMAPQAMPAKKRGLFSFGGSSRSRRTTANYQSAVGSAHYPSPDMAADDMDFDEMVTARGAGAAPGGGGGVVARRVNALAPEPEPELVAGAELLAYGDLRMPAPRSAGRGSLRPAGPAQLYLEVLAKQRIEITFDVITVIAAAARRADAVTRVPLPARCAPIRVDYYDYVYTADTHVDVPSDGTFHSIPLLTREADTKTRYVVVPRESTDVFRVAEIVNPLGAPILNGPIDVYLGKDFLLTSDVHFTPPGGTVRLGLGVEQAIKVSRNTAFREETAGLMRGSLALKHQIRIEVQNHTGHAIDCEVRERIPATREDEDDIEVTVERSQPTWKPYEPTLAESPAEAELEGGYAWRIDVENGEKKSLEADYAIKISAKSELSGGNRREV